jgi:hypothetical protein
MDLLLNVIFYDNLDNHDRYIEIELYLALSMAYIIKVMLFCFSRQEAEPILIERKGVILKNR